MIVGVPTYRKKSVNGIFRYSVAHESRMEDNKSLKLKIPLCLIKYHTIKTYEGVEVHVVGHMINLGTRRRWLIGFTSSLLLHILRKEFRDCLDDIKRRKFYCLCRESHPDSSAVQPVTYRYSNCASGACNEAINLKS